MKILLVSPLPPPMGGIATVTDRLINELSSPDFEFECVNIAHRVNVKNNMITNYNKFEPIIILFRAIISVVIRCLKNQCDIIHINSSSGAGTIRDYLIERVAKLFNIPVILHYHCNLDDAVNNSTLAKKYHTKCFNLASKIIVLNEISRDFVESTGYEACIIPNGIPANLITSNHYISDSIRKVVFTGRVSICKGCLEIYDCVKENPEVDFYLAGLIDRGIEDKMRTLPNIKLLGVLSHNKVIELLDEADVFVFPTYTEGFSMSLLEAMARGVPCITTCVGANEDMIEDMGGVIIKPQDSKAVIDAIKKISSPCVRLKMSTWNLKKVSNKYTEEKMFNSFISIYQELNSI